MPAITKHLEVLESAGLITRGRRAQWRPCRIETQPLRAAADWMEAYRHIWEAKLEGRYLRDLQSRNKKEAPDR